MPLPRLWRLHRRWPLRPAGGRSWQALNCRWSGRVRRIGDGHRIERRNGVGGMTQEMQREPIAWRGTLLAAVVLGALLVVLAPRYGYERDELYFRMLPAAWGYVDQPPLTPLLVHGISSAVDTVWAIRLPAAFLAAASVVVVALIAREVGGGRLAQEFAAWGFAFGTFTLVFGHSFLTGTIDLLVWPTVLLGSLRAVGRRDGRWWLLAGAAAGLGLSNKLLVAYLLLGIAVGLLVVGPRHELRSPWLWSAVLVILVLAAPDLLYQANHGLPQLRMGRALAEDGGGVGHLLAVPYLVLLLSPVLVPIWIAGLVASFRRPAWRWLRFVSVAFVVVVVLSAVGGGQVYYPYGALVGVFALGCVPTAEWAQRKGRVRGASTALAVSAVVTSLIALPIVPVGVLGATPIPTINLAAADQVGWPQLAAAVDRAGAGTGTGQGTIVLTSNYGEAGALARYSARFAHSVWSGHNSLQALPPPARQPETVLVIGDQISLLRSAFRQCRTVARIDNGVGVDNEEQGEAITRCDGLLIPISSLLHRAAHLD